MYDDVWLWDAGEVSAKDFSGGRHTAQSLDPLGSIGNDSVWVVAATGNSAKGPWGRLACFVQKAGKASGLLSKQGARLCSRCGAIIEGYKRRSTWQLQFVPQPASEGLLRPSGLFCHAPSTC
jgi:hypothetical protein